MVSARSALSLEEGTAGTSWTVAAWTAELQSQGVGSSGSEAGELGAGGPGGDQR